MPPDCLSSNPDIKVDFISVETHCIKAGISKIVHEYFLTGFVTWTLLRFDKSYNSLPRKICIISEGSWVL